MTIVSGKKKSRGFYIKKILYYTITFKTIKYLLKLYGYYTIHFLHGQSSAKIGRGTQIHPTVIIRSPQNVVIGENCFFNHNTIINGGKEHAKLIIGDNVQTGPNVAIYAYNHAFENRGKPINEQGYIDKDVLIGNDVWIGANTVILPGTTIGNGVVIGAGSIVSKSLPEYSICAGIPAKVIKFREE